MNYTESLEFIDSFVNFEKISRYNYAESFKLERMKEFLQELGNPHQVLDIIHIAGSKGKGSTCAIISALLRETGYCVGLYTSPHLLDVRERIRILVHSPQSIVHSIGGFEGCINEDEFVGLIERIKPVAEEFRDNKELGRLSFFEVLTACAFLYFKEKQVDFAVLETGLGGRLDATNVAESMVCGITNISLEHTDKLGSSLSAIAREKAGIVKVHSRQSIVHSQQFPPSSSSGGLRWTGIVHSSVVSAQQEEEAMDVIREVCREKKAKLYEIGRDIKYSIVCSDTEKQIFDIDGPGFSYKGLELNLLGEHQVENVAISIGIVKLIETSVQPVLKNVHWPGRLQVVQRDPYVVLDGAHNVASIKAVLSAIKNIFSYKRLISVFGISSDKDIIGVSMELDKVSDIVILTKSRNSRAKEPFYLKENFSKAKWTLTSGVEEALVYGLKIADKNDLVLVTGSLYLVGEALGTLNYAEHYAEPTRNMTVKVPH